MKLELFYDNSKLKDIINEQQIDYINPLTYY